MLNIICHIQRKLALRVAAMQAFHSLRVVQQHAVLQVCNPLGRLQQLALLNIRIAERKGVVYLHAALDCRARSQRNCDDKKILPLAQLVVRHHAAADRRRCGKPFPQRGAIALAHHAQQKAFQIVGIVLCLRGAIWRRGGQFLLSLPSPLPNSQVSLFLLVNADVLQFQFFAIEYVVHGAQHLQHAFHRHADNSPHARDQRFRFLAGKIQPEGKLPQLPLIFPNLPRRADDKFCIPSIDHAIVVKLWRDIVPHMVCDRKNFLPPKRHGIFGKVHHGIEENLRFSFKNANGNARKTANGRAKVPHIHLLHRATSI